MQTLPYSYTISACGCVLVFDTTYIRGKEKHYFPELYLISPTDENLRLLQFYAVNFVPQFKVTLVLGSKCLYLNLRLLNFRQ